MVMTKTKKDSETKDTKAKSSAAKPKGKFIEAIGRRKTAVARVRVYRTGTGSVTVNGEDKEYFTADQVTIFKQPLKLSGLLKDADISIFVSGSGKKSQAEAAKHGISRVLLKLDSELRPALKAKAFLTRDAREKERKKPGLKKARRAPQWSKR